MSNIFEDLFGDMHGGEGTNFALRQQIIRLESERDDLQRENTALRKRLSDIRALADGLGTLKIAQ